MSTLRIQGEYEILSPVISVIIPTLNEGGLLEGTLRLLAQNTAPHEVIVSDAGGGDTTPEVAARFGAKLLTSPRIGRAVQMNHGASVATGDILLFLHADTYVRKTSLRQIETALQNPMTIGGGFARQFDSTSRFLSFTCWLATWRCRGLGWFLGDQAIFVLKNVFSQLRGFKEMSVFEDLDFSRRMARAGKVVTISPGVLSSARRFHQRGPLRTTCSDFWLTCRYLAGLRVGSSQT